MIHGLDTASRKWHVVREDGGYDSHAVRPRVPTDEARIELADTWRRYVDSEVSPGDVVVCEEPLGLTNPMTSRILAMAAGSIHLATYWPRPDAFINRAPGWLGSDLVRWVWADVAQWKRLVVGAGNADKDQIAAWALLTYGVAYEDQDHADAMGIRDFGLLMEGMGWERPLSLKELGKLRKKDEAAADAHERLVAQGRSRLELWRLRAESAA